MSQNPSMKKIQIVQDLLVHPSTLRLPSTDGSQHHGSPATAQQRTSENVIYIADSDIEDEFAGVHGNLESHQTRPASDQRLPPPPPPQMQHPDHLHHQHSTHAEQQMLLPPVNLIAVKEHSMRWL
ncbi:uncharacterized protein LOC116183018 [Photinus pyralis]|nr:uncharacterized protein LOC116183018 [Photinus pyralis]